MNEPLTYEDFISQVEEAMSLDSPFRILDRDSEITTNEEVKTTNSNFQFKDIEIGKIYVFWSGWDTWFLSPTSILDESDYSVYWCYYYPKSESRVWEVTPDGQSHEKDLCGGWGNYVWSGSRWKVLNDTPPFKDAFINWDKLPRGRK